MHYVVKTFRDAGLEAKWGKVNDGRPAIFVRNPQAATEHQRDQWWVCDKKMFDSMKEEGVVDGFNAWTAFGNFFSVPA